MLRTIGVIDKIKVGDVAGAMQKAALKWAALPEGPGLANHYPPQPYVEYSKFLASYRAAEEREMRSLITTAALAGCCFATSAALADGAQKGTQRGRAGIAEGEALLPARAKLLKQGWRPHGGIPRTVMNTAVQSCSSLATKFSRWTRALWTAHGASSTTPKKGKACAWIPSENSCAT
jgi:hypothetical protein